MKHEYSSDELRELKSIYDESGEAGLSRDEMRALRKAGLVKQDLPPEPEKPHEDTLADYQAVSKPTAEPSKRDLILAHCRNRIDQGQPFDGKETAEALGISQKTAGNIIGQLRKEGLLPAFDKHSPRKTTQKPTTTGKKKETMTTTSKITADNVTETKLTPSDVTTGTITVKPESEAEITKLRTSALDIANLVVNYFDADIIKADINKPSNQQGA